MDNLQSEQKTIPKPLLPPAMMVVITLFLMWITAFSLPTFHYQWTYTKYVMIVFYFIGAALIIISALQFKRAATTLNPLNPAETTHLVTGGLFSLSRNPIYVGFVFILIGWAVTLEHPIIYLFLPLFIFFMNRYQIIPEEVALRRQFGDAYQNYRNKVRRWI